MRLRLNLDSRCYNTYNFRSQDWSFSMKVAFKVVTKRRSWWSKAWEQEQTRDILTALFALLGLTAIVATAFDRLGWLLSTEGVIAVIPVAVVLGLVLYLLIAKLTTWANTHGWG